MSHSSPLREDESVVETVQFPTADRNADPVPGEASVLQSIDRRLAELVRLGRLGLGLAIALVVWQVFGGGLAWMVNAATWTAGAAVLILAGLGVAAYVSPRFRRMIVRGAGNVGQRVMRSVGAADSKRPR